MEDGIEVVGIPGKVDQKGKGVIWTIPEEEVWKMKIKEDEDTLGPPCQAGPDLWFGLVLRRLERGDAVILMPNLSVKPVNVDLTVIARDGKGVVLHEINKVTKRILHRHSVNVKLPCLFGEIEGELTLEMKVGSCEEDQGPTTAP